MSAKAILVVGGGAQRAELETAFSHHGPLSIVYSDIDINADVDLFCDAHELPFVDDVFDAVITTAVLEHVLYPENVAGELARVIKPGGRIYSELPFMQQVHEGAYDFTRYTLSGHRRLLNRFREIEAGMVAGPGTTLAWSLEYFFASFASRRIIRNGIRLVTRYMTFWLKWFDNLLKHNPVALDGASCTYFYGAKSIDVRPDQSIIDSYVGGQSLSHY